MSNTRKPARPSLAPKHTRTTEENRTAKLDEGVRLTIDGEAYEVRVGDLTPQLVREMRALSGYSFTRLSEVLGTDPDVDVISTFMWLARRVRGEDVDHDDVAVTYADILGDGFDIAQAGPREVEDSPET